MEREGEIRNAKITRTSLGIEDHGILTCVLHLDYGGSSQGAGNYSLDQPVHEGGKFVGRRGRAAGMEFIRRILETLRVDYWEDLPGTYIRVRQGGGDEGVVAIGHITQDRWLDFKEYWSKYGPLTEEEVG